MLTGRVLVSGAVVLAVALSGCGSSNGSVAPAAKTTTPSPSAAPGALPIAGAGSDHITTTPAPRLAVAAFHTRGVVPQVKGLHHSAAANAALLAAVTRDEHAFEPRARIQAAAVEQQSMMQGSQPIPASSVTYAVSPKPAQIVATPVVVSALIPVSRSSVFQPDDYISATIDMKAGKPVTFDDLFKHPTAARHALARSATAQLFGTVACMKNVPRSYVKGLRPTATDYAVFALLGDGVAIGFGGDQTLCGRQSATVPYAAVQRYLTPLGRRLVAGARAATSGN